MRTGKSEKSSQQGSAGFDADADRYPGAIQGLRRVLRDGNLPDEPVEWLEIQFLASGEAVYRWRLPRADEDDGGYLGPE